MSSVSGTSGPLSASAIIGKVVGSGSHILRVEGYSGTKGLGNGSHIASETFVAGGHRWRLHYYPDSRNYRWGSDSITITLNRVDRDFYNELETNFTISLLDQDGNPVPSYSRTYRHTFELFMVERGDALIQRSDLEKSAYLKDDSFCVRCDVTVVNKVFTKAIPVSEVLGVGGVVNVKQER